MDGKLVMVGKYNNAFTPYLPYDMDGCSIYQSASLAKHILKRHPECLKYMDAISDVIASPDYIGINPNEKGCSFELVKVLI